MRERPILFNGEMVKAILEGRKTQTRRVVKDQDEAKYSMDRRHLYQRELHHIGPGEGTPAHLLEPYKNLVRSCPYGQRGDRLWVRETWKTYKSLDDCKPSQIREGAGIEYQAHGTSLPGKSHLLGMGKWRPSIFMVRWMSRITLEVESVRVERLQDISYNDIKAEGFHGAPADADFPGDWRELWDSINGDGSWNSNPWVWVVEFRSEEGGFS